MTVMIKGKLAVDGDPEMVRASDTLITLEESMLESTEEEWIQWTAAIVGQLGAEAHEFRFAVVEAQIFDIRSVAIEVSGHRASFEARRAHRESSARFLS
jgi:hypothetical protein